MKMSKLFSQTLKSAPADVEVESHKLMLRAGFIRQHAAGIFSYLPLARRAMRKIEKIMREELEKIGGQEVSMPVVQPAELLQETGRWSLVGSEMGRFKDKNQHDMVLAMTYEEAVGDLVRGEIRSYRQLPQLIYQIQTKWRDDPRSRAGLIRLREFTMLDSYSLDTDWDGLDKQYRNHLSAYERIFRRCGLPFKVVKSDSGMMGRRTAHEFMYISPIGEDSLVFCDGCGYSANRQTARFRRPQPEVEEILELCKVATPHAASIQNLANHLSIPPSKTAKAVFFMAETIGCEQPRFIFAIVRGDMDVNEYKILKLLNACSLRPATEDEIKLTGAVPGYASPIGLKPVANVMIIVDELIPECFNLAAGANEEGFHFINTNYGRDFTSYIVGDLVNAKEGDACPECGEPVRMERGVEVGNIFQLGTRYSEAMNCRFQDENGENKLVVMGSYGIGVGRLLACLAEEHHDEHGLRLPVTISPYQVYLIVLPGKSLEILPVAEKLYTELIEVGVEVLFDDRPDSPGVKFNDADLIGCPIRLTVGERSLKQGGVEMKLRESQEILTHSIHSVIEEVQKELMRLNSAYLSD
jgi:prolyl-tRNA synthetase